MEQVLAHRQPPPRTADERIRLITTTLLLLGGAFVLVWMWLIRDYHVFIDRVTPFVPDTAKLVMTTPFDEGLASVLSSFDGDFGRTLQSLRMDHGSSIAFFVDKNVDNGALQWHLITNAVVDEDILPDKISLASMHGITHLSPNESGFTVPELLKAPRLRIMKRGFGTGYFTDELLGSVLRIGPENPGSRKPLTIEWGGDKVTLRMGHRLRSMVRAYEPPIHARQLTSLPDTVSFYGIFPSSMPDFELEDRMIDSPVWEAVRIANTTAEIALSNEGHFALLLHGSAPKAPILEALEQPFINRLSELLPDEVRRILPDGTSMTELKAKFGEVELDERPLPNDIVLRTYRSEDDRSYAFMLYPDGRIWISDDVSFVSSLLISGTTPPMRGDACQPSFTSPGAAFSLNHIKANASFGPSLLSTLNHFSLMTLKLESAETDLYTFCGYF